ncbi:ABC multidrug transporter [Pseudozyma hubeiensis SY62]|uniref:ABC multidrug transporter n=1 Tax=Pseudozyma hubeiensis (strain SY62) TaxID=1305764 RepID=R9P0M7_PSEHS|nr:ABC multidrug transporter [Pseudozyma hubeiensis SY62]GAC94763.1 ABC multidrug transporter [Pseudozyma hubeiensis SY62]
MPTCNDGDFSPVSNCRFFDFTLRFSNVVFVILPSCIAIVLFAARLNRLRRKPDIRGVSQPHRLPLVPFCRPDADPISLLGASVFLINALLNLVVFVIIAVPSSSTLRHALDQTTALPSYILLLLASGLAVPLSVAERKKTRGGSMLLPLWLLVSLLFNASRIRTFNAVPAIRSSPIFTIDLVSFSCLGILLTLENASGLPTAEHKHDSTHESRAGFFSRLLFVWVFPLLWSGYRSPLQLDNLQALKTEFYGQSLAHEFVAAWTGVSIEPQRPHSMSQDHDFDDIKNRINTSAEHPKSESYPLEKLPSSWCDDDRNGPGHGHKIFPPRVVQRSLLSATLRAFPRSALAPMPWKLLLTACQLAQPFLVSTTLAFVQSYAESDEAQTHDAAQPKVYGWGLVGAYAFIYLGMALSEGQFWHTSSQLMAKVRGAYVESIYRKGLDLHARVAQTSGGGKAANLMSVDTERIVDAIDVIHEIWSGCITIVVGMYLLYAQLGLVFLASIVSVVICFLLTPLTSRGMGTKQGNWSAATDERVDLTTSIISDIKGAKLSAYEDILHAKVCKARAKELSARSTLMKQITEVITFTNSADEMMGFFTFVTLIVVDRLSGSNRFDLNTVFTTLTIFQLIRSPLFQLGQQYASLLQARSSMERIQAFLTSEVKPDVQSAIGEDMNAGSAAETGSDGQALRHAAIFRNASLGWAEETVLANVNIEIPAGKLTMVCGQLGQGKSTLLLALLGECDLLAGEQQLPLLATRVAYVSQDIWLQEKCSIRDNIVFATGDYNEDLYSQALRACALTEDIEGLPKGDATHVNALSGGQRQRVAVARAVYSGAEAYVLDDITSALDAETAAHMWRALMGPAGLLRGKTIVMATNAIHLLHHAQLVIRIDAGKIAESGNYENLSLKGKDAMSRHSLEESQRVLAPEDKSALQPGSDDDHEDILTGSVGLKTYEMWLNAAGRSKVFVFLILCALTTGTLLGTPYYLQAWAKAQQEHRFRHWVAWTAGYLLLPPAVAAFLATGIWIFCVNCAESAGNRLHDAQLKAVLSAPISFFTQWTTGQITNRFSQDIFHIDQTFVFAIINTVGVLMMLFGSLVTMIVATPYLVVLVIVLCVASWAIQRLYLPASRQLRRLEMATKSPLYSAFAETSVPAGLATARALQRDRALLERNTALLNASQRPYYHLFTVRRWLQVWLLLLTTITNIALVLLAVVLRHSLHAGVLGVALVQATSLGASLNQFIVSLTEVEIAGVALERVREFCLVEPEERSAIVEKPPNDHQEDELTIEGKISFDKVSVSYGANLKPALHELSFELSAGKRLGIVGRSGSGKSTVLMALFRMISMRAGTIMLDGVDISQISVKTLRSAMTIIPQTPLLLAASIRENLDPDLTCSDDEIWSALHACHLTEFVKKQPDQLEQLLLTGDTYISTGQRQLLALARALLRKKEILVLDEATSAMDVETEKTVQAVLATKFANCTVIAVAHRIATVIAFDQIICMANGRNVESGAPQELLRARGEFWALAAEQKCV